MPGRKPGHLPEREMPAHSFSRQSAYKNEKPGRNSFVNRPLLHSNYGFSTKTIVMAQENGVSLKGKQGADMETYSALDIAAEIVNRSIDEGFPITQMKLQKVLYFAHGYHLAKFGQPLVKETFEAWKFGPVIPGIYREYSIYGISPITHKNKGRKKPEGTALKAVEVACNSTRDVSALTLSSWTHLNGSPWAAAYKPDVMHIPIDNSRIQEYFAKMLEKDHAA
jgi:uncharacterized phage-associated protein